MIVDDSLGSTTFCQQHQAKRRGKRRKEYFKGIPIKVYLFLLEYCYHQYSIAATYLMK